MTITKSLRFEIAFNSTLYAMLEDMQHAMWRVKNKAMSMAYDWQQFSFSYHERFGEYPKEKDLTGVTLRTDICREVKLLAPLFSSSSTDTACKEAVEQFSQIRTELLKGEASLPSYRRDGSFPIRAQQLKNWVKVSSKKYQVDASLLTKLGSVHYGCKTQVPITLLTGKGSVGVLEGILDGTNKLCNSNIRKRKEKYYLLINYETEVVKKKLCDERVMGIDVGFSVPAYLAINTDCHYGVSVGSIQEIRHFENQVKKRQADMMNQRKHCGEGSIGHGKKTRMKPIDKFIGKVANFKDTKNHNWSRYIVDEAVRMQCGAIQMEDLTDIMVNHNFLKGWTYHDLQTKIEYKAREVGIRVLKVSPSYTSARCSSCGFIHGKENKAKWRPTQDQFICTHCEYGRSSFVHADWNAARNISTPNIQEIIQEQLVAQRTHEARLCLA